MTGSPQLDRRSLLVSAAAIGGGLSLGLRIPFGLAGAQAADSVPEVNAWVVIRPDDTVVIRIARSEMGQGTLTGLAQLVAEELDCDWSKITTEFPTPVKTWRAIASGGIFRPAAAAASASRTSMSGKEARRRATC